MLFLQFFEKCFFTYVFTKGSSFLLSFCVLKIASDPIIGKFVIVFTCKKLYCIYDAFICQKLKKLRNMGNKNGCGNAI